MSSNNWDMGSLWHSRPISEFVHGIVGVYTKYSYLYRYRTYDYFHIDGVG